MSLTDSLSNNVTYSAVLGTGQLIITIVIIIIIMITLIMIIVVVARGRCGDRC